MAKINIVLADADELYLNHLTNYLMKRVNTFEVFSFTTKNSLDRFISDKSNKVDIIAFAEEFMDDTVASARICTKIVLTDGSFTELPEFDSVNKYQKAESFINNILMIYAEKTGRVEVISDGTKETQLIGFYSPVGGSGKTVLALSTAYALALRGKRVFYLNLENINSTVGVLNKAANGNMSDIYLALKTKGANAQLRIAANKYTDANTGISYINPAESSLEINELTADEALMFLRVFKESGEFDYVIIDFDSECNKEKISALHECDKIILPFYAGETALSKIILFMKELDMYDELAELKEKICAILNKHNNQNNTFLENSGISSVCEVKAAVSLSPVFSDIKNIFHSGEAITQLLGALIEKI